MVTLLSFKLGSLILTTHTETFSPYLIVFVNVYLHDVVYLPIFLYCVIVVPRLHDASASTVKCRCIVAVRLAVRAGQPQIYSPVGFQFNPN
jgi:hypothetical protein